VYASARRSHDVAGSCTIRSWVQAEAADGGAAASALFKAVPNCLLCAARRLSHSGPGPLDVLRQQLLWGWGEHAISASVSPASRRARVLATAAERTC
jgi:hypothetical protein